MFRPFWGGFPYNHFPVRGDQPTGTLAINCLNGSNQGVCFPPCFTASRVYLAFSLRFQEANHAKIEFFEIPKGVKIQRRIPKNGGLEDDFSFQLGEFFGCLLNFPGCILPSKCIVFL